MKKIVKLKDFKNNNSDSILIRGEFNSFFGGFTQETNNSCFTLDDTCVSGRSDIHHVVERDGVVTSDTTSWTDMSTCQ